VVFSTECFVYKCNDIEFVAYVVGWTRQISGLDTHVFRT
jgi:hypothetical protein